MDKPQRGRAVRVRASCTALVGRLMKSADDLGVDPASTRQA
ncbi:MAG: hypothetical protein ACRDQ7_11925 [Haloechinothrix sp.]